MNSLFFKYMSRNIQFIMNCETVHSFLRLFFIFLLHYCRLNIQAYSVIYCVECKIEASTQSSVKYMNFEICESLPPLLCARRNITFNKCRNVNMVSLKKHKRFSASGCVYIRKEGHVIFIVPHIGQTWGFSACAQPQGVNHKHRTIGQGEKRKEEKR